MGKEDLAVYAALMKVQVRLQAKKNNEAKDKFGKKLYSYRSAEDILESAKPLCQEEGLCIVMKGEHVRTDEITHTSYMKSVISVVDIATGGEISSEFEIAIGQPERMGLGQWYGAVASYARKYVLCGLFAIDNSKDIDLDSDVVRGTANGNITGPVPQSISKEQAEDVILEKVKKEVERLGINFKVVSNIIKRKFARDKFSELNTIQQNTLLTNLDKWSKET